MQPDLTPKALAQRLDAVERLLKPGGQTRLDPAVLDRAKLFNMLQGSAGYETATDDIGAGAVTSSKIATLPHACIYQVAAANHTATAAWQKAPFDTVQYDGGARGVAQADLANDRLYCRIPGMYYINTIINWVAGGAGNRGALTDLNDTMPGAVTGIITQDFEPAMAGPGSNYVGAPGLQRLVVGDYVQAFGYQNSGGNLAYVVGRRDVMFLEMAWLSP